MSHNGPSFTVEYDYKDFTLSLGVANFLLWATESAPTSFYEAQASHSGWQKCKKPEVFREFMEGLQTKLGYTVTCGYHGTLDLDHWVPLKGHLDQPIRYLPFAIAGIELLAVEWGGGIYVRKPRNGRSIESCLMLSIEMNHIRLGSLSHGGLCASPNKDFSDAWKSPELWDGSEMEYGKAYWVNPYTSSGLKGGIYCDKKMLSIVPATYEND